MTTLRSLLAVVALTFLANQAFAGGSVGNGTYGGGPTNQVTITIVVHPTTNEATVTYEHGGETRTASGTPASTTPPEVSDAGEVTFSDDRQYRIKNGEVQWSKVGSPHWSPLRKLKKDAEPKPVN